jgi:xanthine dehydrogenase YagS FAD-binding subunit
MKSFEYIRAKDAKQAIADVAFPEAKFLGGGTNLIDLMKMGVEAPSRLVDINRLTLATIQELPTGGGLRIGALARNSDVAEHPLIRSNYPLLREALLAGASPQLRNLATVGGNILQRTRCYYFCDPAFPSCNKRDPGSGCGAIEGYNRIHAILGHSRQCIATHPSDMCVALAAFEAKIQVTGPSGTREIAFSEFHRLPGDTPERETELARNELITAVDLPLVPLSATSIYLKVRDRASYAFALVSVAALCEMDGKRFKKARLALGGVAHKPWRALAAEKMLEGNDASNELFAKAADAELKDASAFPHNRFKIDLAKRSIVHALQKVAATS